MFGRVGNKDAKIICVNEEKKTMAVVFDFCYNDVYEDYESGEKRFTQSWFHCTWTGKKALARYRMLKKGTEHFIEGRVTIKKVGKGIYVNISVLDIYDGHYRFAPYQQLKYDEE